MTLQLLLRIFRARWLMMSLIFGGCLAAGLALYWIHPKEYTASVALVITSYPQSSLTSQRDVGNPAEGPGANSYMLTQKDILTSRPVASKAISRLKGGATRKDAGKKPIPVYPSEISALQEHLDVEFSGGGQGGSVIRVSYTARKPQRAAAVANAIASAYLQTKLQLETQPILSSLPWYATQVGDFSQRLKKAQTALARYKTGHKIVGGNINEGGLPTQRLATLSQELALAEIKAQQAKEQADEIRRLWQQGRNSSSIPGIMDSGLVQQLRVQLLITQSQLQSMGAQLGENNPRYREAAERVAQLKARYRAAIVSVIRSKRNIAQAAAATAASLQKRLDQQQREVLQTQGGQVTLPILIGRVQAAQQAYDGMLRLYNQQLLRSQMQSTNVSILNSAEPPLSPSAPKLKIYAAAAFIIGLLAAIGVALLVELINPKIRSRDDAERGLGLKLLGDLRSE